MTVHLTTKWVEIDATGSAQEVFLSDLLEADSGVANGGFRFDGKTGLMTIEIKDISSAITATGSPIFKPNKDSVGLEETDAISIDSAIPVVDGLDIHTTGAGYMDLRLQVVAGKAKFQIRLVSKTQ